MKTESQTQKALKMRQSGSISNNANANRRRIEQKYGSGGERVRSESVFGTVRGEKRAAFGSGERAERGGDGRGVVGATFFFFFCVSLLQSLFENDILKK